MKRKLLWATLLSLLAVTTTPAQISLNLGSIPAGKSVTITFDVAAADPLGAGVELISQQGTVTSGGVQSMTDDPETVALDDPTTTVIVAAPDLELIKDDGATTATPGGTILYTLDYANNGDQDATGVEITDVVPEHTTYNAALSSPGWVLTGSGDAGSTLTFAVGALPTTGTGTLNLAFDVNSPAPLGLTELINEARIDDGGSNGPDQNPADNITSDTTPLDASPLLFLSKDDGGTTVTPGGTVVYTLFYTNAGDQDTTGVVITDLLPAHTSFDAGASTPGWIEVNPGQFTFPIGALDVDTTGTVLFAVTVDNPVPSGVTSIDNSATITDQDANSAPAADSTPLIAMPDLAVSKDDGITTAVPGQTISYEIFYANNGDQASTGVVVTELLPPNTSFNAAASTPGWVDQGGGVFTFDIGTLDGGGTNGTLTFAVDVDNPIDQYVEFIFNTVSIADSGADGPDANPDDNGFDMQTPVAAFPDLSLLKDDGGTTVGAGGTVAYTLLWGNFGDQDTTGVMILETLPEHTVFNPAASTPGWIDLGGGQFKFNVFDLDGGTTGTAIFAVDVVNPVPVGVELIVNEAAIMDDGSQGPEFSLDDNMTSDTTPVIAGPDLSIDKDDGGVTVIPGGTISYLLTYGNHGDQNTTGVVIMESVPADTVFNGAASSPGWVDQGGGVYRYEVGGLDVGTTGTLIFAVDVNDPVGPFTEIITNITSLSDDGQGGPDLNPDDNSSTDTTPVDAEVELAISKTDGGVSVQPDGTVVYTIAYANLGNQDSPEVRITDTIPALTSYAAGSSSPGWVEAGPVVTYDVGLLGGYTTGVLQIAFTVQNPVPAGAIQIENVVVIDDVYSGQQPVMPIDDAMAMDTTPLIAEPDLRIRKDDNSARVEAGGQLVSYEIFYINEGNQDATGVQVTETLPAFTTFNAGASTPGWMDQGGGVYTFDVGDLGVGPWEPPAPLVFAVNMLDPLPSDYTVTTNTVTIADDGANGADPNPANNTASDITPLKTMSSSTLIVFEDLKVAQQLYNDFEYNDFVMRSDVTETYDANNKLELIEMRVEALARGAIFNHIARLDLGLEGGVTATIQRFDANDVLVSQDIFVSADNPARSLQIFPLTKDALPPFPGGGGQLTNTEEQQSLAERTEGHYALITIRPRNAPANERIVDDPATTLDEHNSAIYGYNLYVVNSGSTIYHGWDHNTATLDIVSGSQWPASPLIGFPLPQAMLLPTAFEYPVEYTPIWESHLDFEPWIKSGMTTNQNWPLVNVVDEKTWPIDLAKALKRTAAAKAVDGLLFQQKLESAIPATPVLADMTQDGFVDIVYGHYLNLIVIENAFNHSEVVIDPFPEILVDSQCSPVVVDLNGDGLLDVIRGYDNGALVAYRHDGVELTPAGERLYLEGTIKGTPAVGDLDADGDPEIIVQTGHGLLYALGFDFSIRPGFPVDLGGTRDIGSHHFMTPSPALAPLPAGDGLAIIAVNLSGKVFSITWAGDVMPGWPVDLGGEVLASPAVGDLEGDGQIDIVIAMSDAPVYALTAEGQIKPGWPAQRRYGGTSSPSLADVNGDGQLEVFVGSYDENLYGFSADGKTLPGFPVATQSQIFASPFFADLDGDGTPEPLIGSSSGSLYAVCGESGPKADQPAVMAQATTLIATAGSVGDLDFDGRVEVVFGSHDGRIRVVETEAPVVPAGKTWNGFRGGLRNPGMISSILQVGNAAQAWELYQ